MRNAEDSPLQLGLRANWRQFSLLVLVNAFVGAMLGLERALVPVIAAEEFRLASVSVMLSFIVSFGLIKALANLFAGSMSDRFGRKPLLVAGWLVGLPVPFLIMGAPSWGWIVFANLLLGINQGLCWSTAVIMKVDLVGPKRRGLATGLNEFSGYLAMALSTMASGWIAAQTALRPYPFYLGVAYVGLGLILSLLLVRETLDYSRQEAAALSPVAPIRRPSFQEVFRQVSWQDRAFFSLSQGGLVNNLNDVVIWGLLPLIAIRRNIPIEQAAALGGMYLAVWGISQLITGPLSDHLGRKPLIAAGLWVQALGIALIALLPQSWWIGAAAMMGFGTGMVYPTLLAAISDRAHPSWRASALGVYRLWRDSGYAVGALLAGLLSDLTGVTTAVVVISLLTAFSGTLVGVLLPQTARPIRSPDRAAVEANP